MRKFSVFTLILGVLTLTAQLVFSQLPTWVTANYPEDDYLIQPIQIAGGDNLEGIVTDAKKELINGLFQNVNSFCNPRQKQAKNVWVSKAEQRKLEQEYSASLMNLNLMRGTNSHLANQLQQVAIQSPTSNLENAGGFTLVSAKRQNLMRTYVEREQKLREQIQVMLARATEAEIINQQRALEAYQQTLPLFEQLKEAVLIQQAVIPPQQQDPAAIYKKLLETATGTGGGSLQMTLPEVNKRVNQLQNQGRMMNTVEDIAASITQQLAVQTAGLQKGEIKINGFTYRRSGQSIAQAKAFQMELRRLLEQAGWKVFVPDPTDRALAVKLEKVSFAIGGTVWENEDKPGGIIKTAIHNVDSGDIVASDDLNLAANLVSACLPSNFEAMLRNENAYAAKKLNIHTASRKVLTGKELKVKAWTNQVMGQSVYYEGDTVTVYCQVNKPAYIRFLYILNDGSYTLLHDNVYIDETWCRKLECLLRLMSLMSCHRSVQRN